MHNPQAIEDDIERIREYLLMKLELMSDREIAKAWFISRSTLYRWKQKNGITVGGGRHPQQTLRIEDLKVEGMDVRELLAHTG